MNQFQIWGYIICGIYLVGMFYIGIASGKKNEDSLEQHFLGGRTMHPAIIAITYVTASTSASIYLGEPGLAYTLGFPSLWNAIVIIPKMIIPAMLYSTKLTKITKEVGALTIPTYLERHYKSGAIRVILSILLVLFYLLPIIAQYKGAGILFNAILGIPYSVSIIVFAIIVCLYVTFGGFRAVAWTDTAQVIPMTICAIALIAAGYFNAGGFKGIYEAYSQIDASLNAMFEPTMYNPIGVVGLYLFWILIFTSNPYLSTKFMALDGGNKKTTRTFLWVTLIFTIIINATYIIGLSGRVLIPGLADADYITVEMTLKYLNPIMAAIITVGILSAIMSTIDSLLLLVAQTISEDLYRGSINKKATDKEVLRLTQISIVAVTIICCIFSIWKTPSFLTIIITIGTAGAGIAIAPSLLCSVYWKKANKWGSLASIIGGIIVYGYLVLTSGKGVYELILYGAIVSFGLLFGVSLLTNNKNVELQK